MYFSLIRINSTLASVSMCKVKHQKQVYNKSDLTYAKKFKKYIERVTSIVDGSDKKMPNTEVRPSSNTKRYYCRKT